MQVRTVAYIIRAIQRTRKRGTFLANLAIRGQSSWPRVLPVLPRSLSKVPSSVCLWHLLPSPSGTLSEAHRARCADASSKDSVFANTGGDRRCLSGRKCCKKGLRGEMTQPVRPPAFMAQNERPGDDDLPPTQSTSC